MLISIPHSNCLKNVPRKSVQTARSFCLSKMFLGHFLGCSVLSNLDRHSFGDTEQCLYNCTYTNYIHRFLPAATFVYSQSFPCSNQQLYTQDPKGKQTLFVKRSLLGKKGGGGTVKSREGLPSTSRGRKGHSIPAGGQTKGTESGNQLHWL